MLHPANYNSPMENTLVILKPDCLERGLVGEVITRIERKRLRIVAMKLLQIDKQLAATHYAMLKDKPFFGTLMNYITSAPVIVMAVNGDHAVQVMRNLAGATDGTSAAAGTIRGDLATDVTCNLIHASDCPETAALELDRFFGDDELHDIPEFRRF